MSQLMIQPQRQIDPETQKRVATQGRALQHLKLNPAPELNLSQLTELEELVFSFDRKTRFQLLQTFTGKKLSRLSFVEVRLRVEERWLGLAWLEFS